MPFSRCRKSDHAHFWFIYIDIQLQLQFRQIPMTAVAVEYRPAMDSCMVGILSTRLYMTCALTVPDFSDPGKYPEGWRRDIS